MIAVVSRRILDLAIGNPAANDPTTIIQRTGCIEGFLLVEFEGAARVDTTNVRKRMHMDLATVGSWLRSVYRGWCQYHAIPGNYDRLQQLRTALQELWFRRLRRRSQRGRSLTWPKFSKLSRNWLPTPKILHPYPNERFNRLHPR